MRTYRVFFKGSTDVLTNSPEEAIEKARDLDTIVDNLLFECEETYLKY